jgi:LEA14-like dessication related protein
MRRINRLRPAALAAVLGLALAAGGCAGLRDALGMDAPSARVVGASLEDIGLEAATLAFDVEVTNPLAAPLPLANVDYGLSSGGAAFLSGRANLDGTVAAGGTRTVRLPVAVRYADLLKTLAGVRPGSVVPYEAEVGLSVDVPAAGPLRLPMKKEGKMPVPAPPRVEVAEVNWADLTLEKAAGLVTLDIANPNQFPVDLSSFAYALSLGGVQVADTRIAKPVHFDAGGGSAQVEVPIALSPRQLGMAAWNVLTGKGAGYDLTGTMDLATPFGPMNLPIKAIGETVFRK